MLAPDTITNKQLARIRKHFAALLALEVEHNHDCTYMPQIQNACVRLNYTDSEITLTVEADGELPLYEQKDATPEQINLGHFLRTRTYERRWTTPSQLLSLLELLIGFVKIDLGAAHNQRREELEKNKQTA